MRTVRNVAFVMLVAVVFLGGRARGGSLDACSWDPNCVCWDSSMQYFPMWDGQCNYYDCEQVNCGGASQACEQYCWNNFSEIMLFDCGCDVHCECWPINP